MTELNLDVCRYIWCERSLYIFNDAICVFFSILKKTCVCVTHRIWFSSSAGICGSSDLTRASDATSINSLQKQTKHHICAKFTSSNCHVVKQSSLTLPFPQHSPSSRVLCLLSSPQGRYLWWRLQELSIHTREKSRHKLLKPVCLMKRNKAYVPLCRSYSLLPLGLKLSELLVYPPTPPPLAPLLPLIPPLPLKSESTL